jgi:hypothetical protein
MDNEEIIPDNVEIQVNNPPVTEKAEPSLWDEIKTSKNIKEEISTPVQTKMEIKNDDSDYNKYLIIQDVLLIAGISYYLWDEI